MGKRGSWMDGHKRQREQSAKMIEAALFGLMREKDLAQITVSEIVRRADVARRTFYRLYGGKEDVIHCHFERLCQEYRDTYPVLESYDLGRIAQDYFGFWYQHREFLLLMERRGCWGMLYDGISRVSGDIVRNRMDLEEAAGADVELFACYSAGGFLMLLYRWIGEGMQEGPERYAEKVSRSVARFIETVRG